MKRPGKRIFFKYFPSSPQTTISAPSSPLPTSKKKINKNKNKNFLLCHSRKISSLLHSPSSSPCFRFFPPPQWAPLAQTPLKEPRLWELACSGKRGGLRCVYASFLAHPLFRDWPPARGRYLSLSLEFAIPSHVARFAL